MGGERDHLDVNMTTKATYRSGHSVAWVIQLRRHGDTLSVGRELDEVVVGVVP